MGRRFLFTLLLIVFAGCTAGKTDSAIAGDTAAGSQIFSRHCAACHGPDGKGSSMAPSLEAVKDRQMVIQVVTNGRGKMPSFANQLSSQEISSVADYVTGQLAKVSLMGGELSQGGVLYRVN